MKVVEIMRQACAQMGKLYTGYFTRIAPSIIQDQHLRMNRNDFTGGTLFLANPVLQSYIVKESTQDGKLTMQLYEVPIGGMIPDAEQPILPEMKHYSMTTMDRSTLISALNTALISMGEHTVYKDVEVQATNDGDVCLPDEIGDPKRIEHISSVERTNMYSTWDWSVVTDGNKQVIRFRNRLDPLQKIKLRVWYNEPHPYVHDDQDDIHEDYHLRRLVYEVAYHAYFQALAKEQNTSDRDILMFQTTMQERQSLAVKHPVPRITSTIKLPRN